ncbi:MAG: hypothetical protein E7653_04455 [Ruminococcaceae bacterium]|nr:hypothetical protein [Oscillospiraceae bacterium]
MSECENAKKRRVSVRNCTEELLSSLECELEKQTEKTIVAVKKVKGEELSAYLTKMIDGYAKLSCEVEEQHGAKEKCGIKEMISRISSKIDVEVGTMIDDSDERVAQMLIEDITVSVTDIIRLVRELENSNCSEKALSLARETVSFQERSAEHLKDYL